MPFAHETTGSREGFTNSVEFIEFWPDRSGSRLEISDFLIQNSKFEKLYKKYVKN
jgi:hypothetical protein